MLEIIIKLEPVLV